LSGIKEIARRIGSNTASEIPMQKKYFLTNRSVSQKIFFTQGKKNGLFFWEKPKKRQYFSLFLPYEETQLGLYQHEKPTKRRFGSMNNKFTIPSFKNEDDERKFWAKTDLSKHFKPEDFETAVFPNLKPTSQAISIRIPAYLLSRLKEEANSLMVPYQSLIKSYIQKGLMKS
jgi:predicted DNA binding CopG/RHH family protein